MKPVTALVLGSLMVLLGLAFGLAWVPSSFADSVAYGAAGACPEPTSNGSGCWTEVTSTVTGTHVYYKARGNSDWVVHLSDQFGQQRPSVAHSGVSKTLTGGETVVARFWHGSVALIRVPGSGDLPTDNEPGRQLGIATLTAVFTLLAGFALFLGGLGVHRHARPGCAGFPETSGLTMSSTRSPHPPVCGSRHIRHPLLQPGRHDDCLGVVRRAASAGGSRQPGSGGAWLRGCCITGRAQRCSRGDCPENHASLPASLTFFFQYPKG